MTSNTITIHTDGSCLGNGSATAPGGWGAVLENKNTQLRISGQETNTTNNQMELMAILESLKAIKTPNANVILWTDSTYARNGCMDWRHKWKNAGWTREKNKPVGNLELWKALDELLDRHNVEVRWVRGHSGNRPNELADKLSLAAAHGNLVREYRRKGDYEFRSQSGSCKSVKTQRETCEVRSFKATEPQPSHGDSECKRALERTKLSWQRRGQPRPKRIIKERPVRRVGKLEL